MRCTAQPPAPSAQTFEGGENENEGSSSGWSYEKATKLRLISQMIGSTLLILVSIMKIISIADAPPIRVVIVCIYLLILGLLLALVEYGHTTACQLFLFLCYGHGKAFACLFIIVTTLSYSSRSWLEYVILAVFCVSAFFNVYVSCKYKFEESQRLNKIFDEIRKKQMKGVNPEA